MPQLIGGLLQADPTISITSLSLARLRDRVYAVLMDSNRDFITVPMVDEWINEGYTDLCARLRIPQKVTTGTLSTTGTLALPADFVAPIHFSVGTDIPEWTSQGIFESWRVPADTPGTAVLSRILADTIETYPAKVSAAYSLSYAYTPTELVAITDKPTALPKELVPRIIHYARAEALWTSGQTQEGDRYFARYAASLPESPRALERLHPGPRQISVMPSAIEE
jgi:hypothetical protein